MAAVYVHVDPNSVSGDDDSNLAWRRARFRVLYDENHRDIWRYCLRRARLTEQAEEAFNGTFLVAWKNLDRAPTGGSARPWLFSLARNQVRGAWRSSGRYDRLKQKLRQQRPVEIPSDPADLAPSESQHVLDAVAALRPKDREVLRLALWEELPHSQIAEMLGCTENAVAIRLHRVRQRLAKQLSGSSSAKTPRAETLIDMTLKDEPTPGRVFGQAVIRLGKD